MGSRTARPAPHGPEDRPGKQAFDIHEVIARVRNAVRSFDQAALFALAQEGFDTPFEQLIACIISIRTRDETTGPAARRLFAAARAPEALSRLTPEQIDALIAPCTFHEPKSRQIHAIAHRVARELGGTLPCDSGVLTSFRGVGAKCANLVLGIACGHPAISVDVHVHRVTNRWGYVATRSPEQTMAALQDKLPRTYWIEINRLLVPFGKHICTGIRPRCAACPVLAFCRQIGVTEHR